jgi:hypothetical protein
MCVRLDYLSKGADMGMEIYISVTEGQKHLTIDGYLELLWKILPELRGEECNNLIMNESPSLQPEPETSEGVRDVTK